MSDESSNNQDKEEKSSSSDVEETRENAKDRKIGPPKPPPPGQRGDAEELREIAKVLPDLFSAINESIPQLITNLIGSVYSPDAAGNMAAGIGRFYSKLIEEGIPEEVALDMTKKFVGALDFKKLMSMVSDEAKPKKRRRDDDDDEDF